ncbi:MAG TPA: carboxypeptidase-like regulatory domain-containing protein, partial [Terriglobales bacterium]|nr:carboxypeptidase-like regulatory domain-containing protein [Terriglobales bacterium]
MRLRKAALFAFSLLVTTILVSTVTAQTNQGSIAGNVSDPSGAMVPNAKVVAREVDTGTTYQTVSSSAGAYRFPNVNIGTYNVTATASGFKVATLTGVAVQVASTTALDIKLQTGVVTENVEVNAEAPTVASESSDIGTVVTQQQTLQLPLALGSTVQAMRSPEAFVFLTPGAVGPGSDSGNGGTFESKISGGQNYATEVLLDGASTTRSENGSSFDETAPSVEALGEFKVLTSTIPAEFGRTTGGVESFTTKSGTNAYHGDVYDLFRNEDLDANTWGNDLNLKYNIGPRSASATPLDRQNDYGVTMGGPVRIPHIYNGTDKTFFFFSWEQYRQNQGGVQTSTVPTTPERGGDFSQILDTANVLGTNPCDGTPIYQGEIFDPTTTRTVGGVECRTAFMNEAGSTGNVIPSGMFSNVGQKLMSFYPDPQNGNLTNNYLFPYSYPILDTTTTVRIDQNISEKMKAYFTYSSRENVRISTTPEWAGPAGYGRNQFFGTHFIRFGYDYTISSNMLNHLNLGYNRTNSKNVGAAVGLGHGTDWDSTLGISGASGPMFPGITMNGPNASSGFGDNVDGDTIDNGFRFSDTFNWLHGKHDFKIGYDQWYQQYSPLNFQNTSGSFTFDDGATGGTPTTTNLSGNSIASMLLGDPTTASVSAYAGQARWLRSYFAGFFQDSYKITPTLTINWGIRYEVDEPQKEAYGDTSNIDVTAPNPGAGGLPGVLVFAGKGAGRNGNLNERWANIWYKDVGPRLGFAWAPAMLHGKSVLRGGYGILYGGLQYADFGGFNRTGFAANPSFNSPNGFDPALAIDSGIPAYPAPPNLDPTQLNFQGPQYTAPSSGRPPMIQNWSLEVQHEIVTDLLADVAYVGQHSTNLRSNYDAVNTLNPGYFGLGPLLADTISSPQAIAAGINSPFAGFPSNALVAQALVPFPQYYGFNTDGTLENLGQSTYNALEASLERRFHNGLNLMASYTWSKTLTNADSALPYFATLHQGGAPENVFDPK